MEEKHSQPSEEELNDAIERLRHGQSMGIAPSAQALMAGQINAMTSDDTLDGEVDARTQHALLQRFATQQSTHTQQNFVTRKRSFLSKISFAFVPAAAIAFAVVAFMMSQDNDATLAQVQGTPSLSRAEELLGQLPADAQLNGVEVAQLRADIHAINQARANTDTTLDPSATLFPHVELRRSALEIIENEKAVLDKVTVTSIEIASIETNITGFEGAVSKWPTQNEGVSYDVHEDAVNAFKKHETEWNQMMAEVIQKLIEKSEY